MFGTQRYKKQNKQNYYEAQVDLVVMNRQMYLRDHATQDTLFGPEEPEVPAPAPQDPDQPGPSGAGGSSGSGKRKRGKSSLLYIFNLKGSQERLKELFQAR